MEFKWTLPVIYFSMYFTLIFIASIYCAIDVKAEYVQEKAKRKQAREANTAQKEMQDALEKEKDVGCKWYLKRWALSIYHKKKVYIQILPHILDQATDFALIMEYYQYKQAKQYVSMFYVSVTIIIIHRIVSCFGVYLLTKNITNVMLQAFELLILRCIYTNHTLNTSEPTSMQRYLHILEAAFEAMPQLILSTVFVTKANTFTLTIVISLISSVWSLTSRVTSDDKSIFKPEWKSLDFKYDKCPIINVQYLLRVLARFFEMGSRLTVLALMWINIGSFGTCIVLLFEFVTLMIICYGYKSFGCVGNLMYFVEDDGKIHRFNWTDTLLIFFMVYKLLSQYLYLILITIFANVDFNSETMDSFELRNKITMIHPFGFSLFLFCWISSILFPILGKYAVKNGTYAGKFNSYKLSTSRHVDHLYRMHAYQDIFEMIEIGKEITELDIKYLTKIANGKSKRDEIEIEISVQQYAQKLLQQIQKQNQSDTENQQNTVTEQ